MNIRYIALIAVAMLGLSSTHAQTVDDEVRSRLNEYFSYYYPPTANVGNIKLKSIDIDHSARKITVYANENFGYQPFTEENVAGIYAQVKALLPGPVHYYELTIIADGKPIEYHVPNALRSKQSKAKDKTFQHVQYKGDAWVRNVSKPYTVSRGLQGKHIALWQSHGRFYDPAKGSWRWQRPRLFGTTEDLLTQAFVVPYIIPMLENAGATVFTPRERDWQRNEVIVDNDTRTAGSRYIEVKYKKYRWKTSPKAGFAQRRAVYTDKQNPFTDGTARYIATMSKAEKAFAEWIPNIPEKGQYAVYVSYQTMKESVSDATYTVFHNGGTTEFKVNQQMGGGTWVYLGTFEFDKGANEYGMVVLSNESKQHGVVCADAVRFGGGMGNVSRGGSTSGLPRYLEGARYWAQWAGFPYEVYSKSGGTNDYNDDINTRGLAVNYLSGGSVYHPNEAGLNVPLSLSMGVHTDAGFTVNRSLVGTLGIYTTDTQNGQLGAGTSRYASRDLADLMLTNLQADISRSFGTQWVRRSMWNRNYSETRLPAIPSMILELLAHQNFADMKYAYDPNFQFVVGRAVYKSILKYLATMHGENYTVQPLPVNHFAIQKKGNSLSLSWEDVTDPAEPTATPTGYVVYSRIGYGGWDNGTYVSGKKFTVSAEEGLAYSFKVTAVNKGGESFPSEILSAYCAPREKGTVLIVNAFDKLSAPRARESVSEEGFDLLNDVGIPYLRTPVFCGPQLTFTTATRGRETSDGTGYSTADWEGRMIAGNTFDYPFIHGKALQALGDYSFVSASDEAVERGDVDLKEYRMIDLLYGADDKGFSAMMQNRLTRYAHAGGAILLSGAKIGGGAVNYANTSAFLSQVLHYQSAGVITEQSEQSVASSAYRVQLYRAPNEIRYALSQTEALVPVGTAFAVFAYENSRAGAGVAYGGTSPTLVLGFPFESIQSAEERKQVMMTALQVFGMK